jgi:hypothetical protein
MAALEVKGGSACPQHFALIEERLVAMEKRLDLLEKNYISLDVVTVDHHKKLEAIAQPDSPAYDTLIKSLASVSLDYDEIRKTSDDLSKMLHALIEHLSVSLPTPKE